MSKCALIFTINSSPEGVLANSVYLIDSPKFNEELPVSINSFMSGTVVNGGWKLVQEDGKFYINKATEDNFLGDSDGVLPMVVSVVDGDLSEYNEFMWRADDELNKVIPSLGLEKSEAASVAAMKIQSHLNNNSAADEIARSQQTKVCNQIAKHILGINTIKVQNADSLDFHSLAVWNIEAALNAAFDAGRNFERRQLPTVMMDENLSHTRISPQADLIESIS